MSQVIDFKKQKEREERRRRWAGEEHDDLKRQMFVDEVDELSDLESYLRTLDDKPNDIWTLTEASKKIYGKDVDGNDLTDAFTSELNPSFAGSSRLQIEIPEREEQIAKYIEKNLKYFLNSLDKKGLEALVMGVKLFKPENSNKNYEKFVDIVDEFKKATSEDQGVREKYLNENLAQLSSTERIYWAIKGGGQDMREKAYKSFAQYSSSRLQEKLEELGENGLRDVLKTSWNIIKDVYDDTPEGYKYRVWIDNMKPYLLALAKVSFKREEEIADRMKQKGKYAQWDNIKKRLRNVHGTKEKPHILRAAA